MTYNHNHRHQHREDHENGEVEKVGQLSVNVEDILREARDNAPNRRCIEPAHWRSKNALEKILVNFQARVDAKVREKIGTSKDENTCEHLEQRICKAKWV